MRNLLYSAFVLASLSTICSAQTITETFGSGANAFTMDFVTIGNPGNAADTTGSPNPAGSVGYTYSIGKYEVSRDMINKANLLGGTGITLSDMSSYNGGVVQNGPNRPAAGISWYEAARFVNYLNTSTGGVGAYKFDGNGNFQLWASGEAGYNLGNLFRNSLAKYWLPSTDEWYKAAYGSPSGAWYDFPTGSNNVPTDVASGTSQYTQVSGDAMTGPADINNAGGLSLWGTMAQGGNMWEWVESASDGINNSALEERDIRGGSWDHWSAASESTVRSARESADETLMIGLRIASSIPEPSSLSLLALGGVLVVLGRRKRA